ncbi:MAG: protein kinase [Vulcanimicrobiota bacterium]
MVFRVHTPDKKVGADGLPITVLPDGHLLRDKYTVSYFTTGGMATIYKARGHVKTFIIKEVDRTNGQAVIALNAEKAMLERLDHPGIVKVEELFEEEGYFYLVTDYIDGENLLKKLPRSSTVFLSEKVVLEWARQLMDIFEYLHSQRPPIIYRDLKPQNIIHDVSTGRIVLIDFGIARVYKEYKQEDTERMGTVITASPEHYGEGQTDIRSDIYTIGATIYMLLSNNVTWREEIFKFPSLRNINSKVSERTAIVVEKALKVRPQDRFQSVAEMKAALFAVSENEDIGEIEAQTRDLAAESHQHGMREHRERDTGTVRIHHSGDSSALHRKICSYCRRKNNDNALQCEFCGQPLLEEGRESLSGTVVNRDALDEKTVNLKYRKGFLGLPTLPEFLKSMTAGSLSKLLLLTGGIALLGVLSAYMLLTLIMSPPSQRSRNNDGSSSQGGAAQPSSSNGTPLAAIDTGAKPTRSAIYSEISSLPPTRTSPSEIPSPSPASSGAAISPSPGLSPSGEPSFSSGKVKNLFERGVDASREGRYREAEDCFMKVLSMDKTKTESYWYLGQVREAVDRNRDALKSYRLYAKSSSADPEKLRHIGRMMMAMKDYKAALPLLVRAQTSSKTSDGFFSLGTCYYHIGDYEKAVWTLRGSMALQKNHLAALLLLAECHDKRGNAGDAYSAYKSAYHMKPEQISLLFQMARMADKMGEYGTSKECLKRYLALESDDSARAEALKMLEEEKIKALKVIPPSVERQRDFIPGVSVMGIFGSGTSYVAHLNIRGSIHEIQNGDRFLSQYYVLSVNADRIVLVRDESYVVLRP